MEEYDYDGSKEDRFWGRVEDGIGSVSCPMKGFDISVVENSVYTFILNGSVSKVEW
jgi:hypothetical protein